MTIPRIESQQKGDAGPMSAPRVLFADGLGAAVGCLDAADTTGCLYGYAASFAELVFVEMPLYKLEALAWAKRRDRRRRNMILMAVIAAAFRRSCTAYRMRERLCELAYHEPIPAGARRRGCLPRLPTSMRKRRLPQYGR
jgi:hypothetical protein